MATPLIRLDTKALEQGLVKIVTGMQKGLDSRKLSGGIAAFVTGRIF